MALHKIKEFYPDDIEDERHVKGMDLYAQEPEFYKEALVREEVRFSKVVDRETATAEEQLRREELDVDTKV